ncbi:unnamed protein product [Urochloa humidicola]
MKLRMGPGGMRVLYEDRRACPTLKLLVDTTASRVLYAEAGREAVYFLFSLLTQGFLEEDLIVGSIGNLENSFKILDGDVGNIPPFPPPLGDDEPGRLPARASAGFRFAEYAVTDDLRVVLMSSISGCMAYRNMLRSKNAGTLQEKTVTLGSTEGWEIWLASLKSKTALTDAFVRKKKPPQHPTVNKRGGAKSFCCMFVWPLLVCALVGLIISWKWKA